MANEKWLIDAEDLKSAIVEDVEIRGENFSRIIRHIEVQPKVDAVEVVRCKNCKYWSEETNFCEVHSHFFHHGMCWDMFCENDFCSYGERKEGDD